MSEKLPGLVVELEAKIDKLERGMARASQLQGRTANQMERRARQSANRMRDYYGSSADGIIASMNKVRAAGVAAIGAIAGNQIVRSIRATISELSNLAKMADRVGFSTREFQGLEFGFGQAGVKVNDLTRAMETFTQRVGEAQQGAGSLLQTLQSFNVSLTDDGGRLRSQYDLLRDMADVLRRLPNQAQRLAIAQAAFGTAGRDMVNALAGGAAGIDQMVEAAQNAGLIMDDSLLRRAEEIDDKFDLVARQITTKFKAMVISSVDGFATLGEKAEEFGETLREAFNVEGIAAIEFPNAVPDQPTREDAMVEARQVPGWFTRAVTGLAPGYGTVAGETGRAALRSASEAAYDGAMSGIARDSITPGALGEEAEQLLDIIKRLSPEAKRLFEDFEDGFAQAATAAGLLMIELADVEANLDLMGDIGAADVMQQFRTEIGALRDDLFAGNITMEEFQDKLAGLSQRAESVARELNATNLVSFDRVISKIDGLRSALASAATAALNLRPAVQQAVERIGEEAAGEQRRVWQAAEAASREADAANQRFVEGQRARNALTSEQIRLETEVTRVRQESAQAGLNLPDADVARLARERLAAEDRRRNEGRVERPARSGGGARAEQTSELQEMIRATNDQITLLELEAAALMATAVTRREYGSAIEYARKKAELLHAAHRDGIQITPELTERIEALARAHVKAGEAVEASARKHRDFERVSQDVERSAESAFVSIVTGSKDAKTALSDLLGQMAEIAASELFKTMMAGGSGGTGGTTGSSGGSTKESVITTIISTIIRAMIGFRDGGYTGDGGRNEPAGVVHKGEYVMSKGATQRIGVANLERLHQGSLKGYAEGGYVGPSRDVGAVRAEASPAAQPISINAPITVNGSAGSPEQNQDLAERMSAQMERKMRATVIEEIRKQTRPGNMLNMGR